VKHFVIEPYGNEKVTFKAINLDDKGRMESSKEANWKQLLQIMKDQLKLTDTSTFLFIKKDNPDDQIDNDGDLMDLWNELNKSRKAMYYTLKMRCLLITKEDKLMTWCPKNSDDPNFRYEMETKNWSQHFEDLKQFVGISTNDEWLSESDQDKRIQSGEDLKAIWAERYKDSDTCCLRLKVISASIGGEQADESIQMKKEEEENGRDLDPSDNKSVTDKEMNGESNEGNITSPLAPVETEHHKQQEDESTKDKDVQGSSVNEDGKEKEKENGDNVDDSDDKKKEIKICRESFTPIPGAVAEKEDFDIGKMLELVKKAEEAANEIKDKNVILFIGGTGTGKSTLIHFLAGSKMEKQMVDGKPHIAPVNIINKALVNVTCSPSAESETKYITAVPISLKELGVRSTKLDNAVLCDTPGFEDTSGPEVDVANGIGIIKALQTCKSVKPVVLISYTALGYRMNCVRELARTLTGIIPSIQNHLSAFAYVFTKFPDDQKQSIHALVNDTYNKIQKEEKDEGYKALLADIADQTEDNVLAPDLLNDHPKILLKKLADSQNFIKDPANVFHPFLTEKSTSAVHLQVEKHKANILHEFKHHHYPIVQTKLDELIALQSVLKSDTIERTYQDCINQLTQDWNTQINAAKHTFNKCMETLHSFSKEDILAYKQIVDEFKSADPLRKHLLEAICADALIQNLKNQTSHLIEEMQEHMKNEFILQTQLDKLVQVGTAFPEFASAYNEACQTLAKHLTNYVNNAKGCLDNHNFEEMRTNLEALVKALSLQSHLISLFDIKQEITNLEKLTLTHLQNVASEAVAKIKGATKELAKEEKSDTSSSSLVRVEKLSESDVKQLETSVMILENAVNVFDLLYQQHVNLGKSVKELFQSFLGE
ncbi:hypothetical protein RFI_35757, partial [Reticulomyxa filosa]